MKFTFLNKSHTPNFSLAPPLKTLQQNPDANIICFPNHTLKILTSVIPKYVEKQDEPNAQHAGFPLTLSSTLYITIPHSSSSDSTTTQRRSLKIDVGFEEHCGGSWWLWEVKGPVGVGLWKEDKVGSDLGREPGWSRHRVC
ncbi:hypothetical protein D8674_003950 [Pyrus ussuriensis x Pyrus communis]|uniref:Uncharacterized protein n=1 Tax=Pyrus ussuriensis x Pyrus communis TaxID=2448454 RepID=A0A5N5FIH6_9ROSA|nr:hypothetical protein D8674_003950 [Pyrus ussuriensis x Pyrus communis]